MVFMFLLFGFLAAAFLMAIAKRISALIQAFRLQALFLFLYVLYMATAQKHFEMYVVSALILVLKVIAIPRLLKRAVRRINIDEGLGLIINPQVSLLISLVLLHISYLFTARIMLLQGSLQAMAFTASVAAVCIGLFIMVSRMKALCQIIGLLVMENGLFLAASAITGGMPFFVEIAFFFDIFIFVMILEVFIYKINKLFTHIDTSKLNTLKG